jgi:hypothetical protein
MRAKPATKAAPAKRVMKKVDDAMSAPKVAKRPRKVAPPAPPPEPVVAPPPETLN